jgi:tetratricopeptide (TPR) repeat protein
MLGIGERVLRVVLRWHYHVPRDVYWLLLLGGSVATGLSLRRAVDLPAYVGGFATVLGLQGLVRWHSDSRPMPVLVVPQFASADFAKALEVQRIIVSTLQDHIGRQDELFRITAIPEVVGPDRVDLATRLKVRLHSVYFLFGEVRSSPQSVAVYARLLGGTQYGIVHQDLFTEDTTPHRSVWQSLFLKLTPAQDPDNSEHPFDFTTEVEGLIRSLEAKILLRIDRPLRAEQLLRETLNRVGDTGSEAADVIRLDLANALVQLGRKPEAIQILRERAQQETVSPDVLRALSYFLFRSPIAGEYEESVQALRRALEDRTDPLRDMTLYNLLMLLGPTEESEELLDELITSRSSHYPRAWYVKRLRGFQHWQKGDELANAGQEEASRREFLLSARWYTAAIRARPRFVPDEGRWVISVPLLRPIILPPRRRYLPIPPKMRANAVDAWVRAGRPFRATFYGWVERRGRRRSWRRGWKALLERRFDTAIIRLGQAVAGRGDEMDIHAHVGCALAEHLIGHDADARYRYGQAIALDPMAARKTAERMWPQVDPSWDEPTPFPFD